MVLRRTARAVVATILLISTAACTGSPQSRPTKSAQPGPHSADFRDDAADMDTVAVHGVPQAPVRDAGRRFLTKCVGHGDRSVLLVSGFMTPLENWSNVQAKIGSVARVCSYDRLGIGRSGPLPPRQTFQTMAADVDRLVEALALSRPLVIVGHSMGGPIAMTWATTHVQDAAGVVLVDAPDHGFNQWQAHVMTDEDKAAYGDPFAPASEDAEHVDSVAAYGDLAELPTLGDVPLLVLTHDPEHPNGVEAFMTDIASPDETRQAWLETQHRWAKFSANSELVTVDGVGHFIQGDDPDAVVAAILATIDATTR